MSAPIDFDGPWKAALEELLEPCFGLLFPEVHRAIDWTVPPRFLDTELQQIAPSSADAPRTVDKLVEVHQRDGVPAWVLVHIEVQNQEQHTFEQRMFDYHARLWLQHRRQIVSMAVLGDERANWRPTEFGYQLWGCDLRLRYPLAKLHDYRARMAELEAERNPFATVVLAHLLAQATRGNPPERAEVKLMLTRRLYRLGYSRSQIIQLYRFIDWLLQLPAHLEAQTWQRIKAFDEEAQMQYISYAERVGREEGLQQGLQEGRQQGLQEGLASGRSAGLLEGIALSLDVKFPEASGALLEKIRELRGSEQLEVVLQAIRTAATPDDLWRALASLQADPE